MKKNGRCFVDGISYYFSWLYAESNSISLKCVLKRQTDKYPAICLDNGLALTGDKPLSEWTMI